MAQKWFHVAELWRAGYRPLYSCIGEKPLIIIITAGVSSLYDKSVFIREAMGCKILWLSRQLFGMRHIRDQEILACCLSTLTQLFKLRKRTDNIVALMVHAAVSHTGVRKLKQLIPGIRVVSYVYDFMNIMVPPEQMAVWAEFHGSADQAKIEYEHLKKIMAGDLADAVIYKDAGENWGHMRGCKKPTLWFPQALSRTLYQKQPEPTVPESFCFIGTIVPKATHARPSGLFDDIMMEDIFAEVADQGFRIHAYVLNPHPDVIQEYREKFRTPQVQLFRGDIVENLLPRCRGRYRWGWMMYHFPASIVLPMVNITLPTKFFTYLALGIPPVVSAEFKAVAKLVRQYKCGVVVTQKQIGELNQILPRQDYKALLRGVLKARQALQLERFLPKIVKLLRQVMKSKPIELEPWSEEESYQVQTPPEEAAYVRATAFDERRGGDLRDGDAPEGTRRQAQNRRRGQRRRQVARC